MRKVSGAGYVSMILDILKGKKICIVFDFYLMAKGKINVGLVRKHL